MMTAALVVVGVFAWGVAVGATLCYLTGARYARDLHERILRLEQQAPRGEVATASFVRLSDLQIAELNQRIFEDLFGHDEEDDEDGTPVTRH